MNTLIQTTTGGGLANVVLGLGGTLVVAGVLTGAIERLGLSESNAFWLLFVIGFLMCALGPLGQGAQVGWWNPRHIAGYVLGGVALLLGASVLFGRALPLIDSPKAAVVALSLIMLAKVIVAFLYPRAG